MKAIILDDDKRICNLIKSLLKKYFSKSFDTIDVVSNTQEAINNIQKFDYHLFLFDIHLGKETSFDIFNFTEKRTMFQQEN